jgi:hypothetical protein
VASTRSRWRLFDRPLLYATITWRRCGSAESFAAEQDCPTGRSTKDTSGGAAGIRVTAGAPRRSRRLRSARQLGRILGLESGPLPEEVGRWEPEPEPVPVPVPGWCRGRGLCQGLCLCLCRGRGRCLCRGPAGRRSPGRSDAKARAGRTPEPRPVGCRGPGRSDAGAPAGRMPRPGQGRTARPGPVDGEQGHLGRIAALRNDDRRGRRACWVAPRIRATGRRSLRCSCPAAGSHGTVDRLLAPFLGCTAHPRHRTPISPANVDFRKGAVSLTMQRCPIVPVRTGTIPRDHAADPAQPIRRGRCEATSRSGPPTARL